MRLGVFVLLVLVLLAAVLVTAQPQGCRVAGRIVDCFGKPVAGCRIVVEKVGGGVVAYTESSSSGEFSVVVEQGAYILKFTAKGYAITRLYSLTNNLALVSAVPIGFFTLIHCSFGPRTMLYILG